MSHKKKRSKKRSPSIRHKHFVSGQKTRVGGVLAACVILIIAIVTFTVISVAFASAKSAGVSSSQPWIVTLLTVCVASAAAMAIWKFRNWRERQVRVREFTKTPIV